MRPDQLLLNHSQILKNPPAELFEHLPQCEVRFPNSPIPMSLRQLCVQMGDAWGLFNEISMRWQAVWNGNLSAISHLSLKSLESVLGHFECLWEITKLNRSAIALHVLEFFPKHLRKILRGKISVGSVCRRET